MIPDHIRDTGDPVRLRIIFVDVSCSNSYEQRSYESGSHMKHGGCKRDGRNSLMPRYLGRDGRKIRYREKFPL
jgi:hypothetical protein